MSNTITSSSTSQLATNSVSPLTQVINSYLDTVKTKSGQFPDKATKENFIATCLAYELNPIKRQAYLTGYDSRDGAKFSTIVGIDGFACIATRTGVYAGKDQARFLFESNKLDSAVVTVYRIVQGQKCGFTGQAFFSEYNQGSPMWAKMPKTMLEKCAFAKALRSAFPESLSGVYSEDEMPKGDVVSTQEEVQITESERKEYFAMIGEFATLSGKTSDKVIEAVKKAFDFDSHKMLPPAKFQIVLTNLQNWIDTKKQQLQEPKPEFVDIQVNSIVELETPQLDALTDKLITQAKVAYKDDQYDKYVQMICNSNEVDQLSELSIAVKKEQIELLKNHIK